MILARNERHKVKTLKKVRRPFLIKHADGTEQQVVDHAARYLTNQDGYPIKVSIGLIEMRRKISVGPENFNAYFNIESTKIENNLQVKAVTLNLCPNENKSVLPWEYTVQRLESYGDLDLAVWAHRVKDYYSNYTQAMANIYDQINSVDPKIQRQIAKIRTRGAITRREIESKYPYNRYIQFFRRDLDQPLSSSYSETFLKVIGYTPESFISWSKEHGLPKLLETNHEVYDTVIKGILNYTPMISDSIREGPASESIIYNKEGSKIKVMVRYVNILEPTEEGIFYYTYILLCDKKTENKEPLALECEKEIDDGVQKKKIVGELSENDSENDRNND